MCRINQEKMSDRKKAERERAMEAENRPGQKSTLSGAPEDRKFHQVEAFLLPNPLTGHREALILTASGSSGTRLNGETQKKPKQPVCSPYAAPEHDFREKPGALSRPFSARIHQPSQSVRSS